MDLFGYKLKIFLEKGILYGFFGAKGQIVWLYVHRYALDLA